MLYRSTRGLAPEVTASGAVVKGLAADGGLYVPAEIPVFEPGELKKLAGLSYAGRAKAILGKYFDDFTPEELDACVEGAWGNAGRFDGEPAPLVRVNGAWLMELWHGPTCAFKDLALQFLPRAMVVARRKLGIEGKTLILAATSGDTGKAALEGFADVPGTHCAVFFPEGGISDVQRLQMTTQRGGNVSVLAVKGNFDDAQSGVKHIFSDTAINEELAKAGWALSSANSINWGRLAPQIVYYVSVWCDLYRDGVIAEGEPVDFVVPTGNFGNILSGWYARAMGLPVGRLVCASNKNRVLTDFFNDGVYDIRRPFFRTISPSMDIIISSNLERLLFELSGRDGNAVRALMDELKDSGVYRVDDAMRARMSEVFLAGCTDDEETTECIEKVFQSTGYLLDTHTAVAWNVYQSLPAQNKTVVVSTANPYKFAGDVLNALEEDYLDRSGNHEDCDKLQELTGIQPPQSIRELWTLPVLHNTVCEKQDMPDALLRVLGVR